LFLVNEHKRRKILQSLILALSVAAILLLAGGLPNLRLKPGKSLNLYDWFLAQLISENSTDFSGNDYETESPGSNLWSRLGEGYRSSIVIAFWLILFFSIVYAIVSPKFRRELVRMFVTIMLLFLLLPSIARRLAQRPRPAEVEEFPGQLSFGDTILPEPPPFIQQPPGWFLILVEVLLLVLVFVGIYLIWRRLRPKSYAQAVVVKNVRQALSDLESGSELEDVVIACYTKMCRELQKSRHIGRHQAMTPREFEDHLTKAGITSAHIRQLTLLFEGVRYGAKPTDSIIEHNAKRCLQAILQAYGD